MDEWTNEQMNAFNVVNTSNDSMHLIHCYIDHSLNIACPALNPERSSLQSDYGASRFSAGEHLSHLFIASEGGLG